MNMFLDGRVCIVTGAARGLGAEFSIAMAAAGARVVATDRLSCRNTVDRITAAKGAAIEVSCDVTSRHDCEALVAKAVEAFGQIDVLVNNAALYGGIKLGSFRDIPETEWDAMMGVNVKGVWQVCRAVSPHMVARRYGRIVNVSSNVIFMGKPQFLHYVASKGAVWAMTSALSRELAGTGITVNAIAPGYTLTDATRSMGTVEQVEQLEQQILESQSVKQLIKPADLVAAILFLASETAGMVTGQTITVDGGTITR